MLLEEREEGALVLEMCCRIDPETFISSRTHAHLVFHPIQRLMDVVLE
jgi:hypothetical protein